MPNPPRPKRGGKAEPVNPLGQIRAAVIDIQYGEDDRNRWIVRAFNDRTGYTVDDIAQAAGLSRPRIYQIVKEAAGD